MEEGNHKVGDDELQCVFVVSILWNSGSFEGYTGQPLMRTRASFGANQHVFKHEVEF